MRRTLISLATLLGVCAAGSVVATGTAHAADNGRWSIFPTTVKGQALNRPYFEPLMKPGVTVRDSVTITNQTKKAIHLNIFGADAYDTASGGFTLRMHHEEQQDIGNWIHLPVSTVTVSAHSQMKVPFEIDPPLNASPGDHPGGIVAEQTSGRVTTSGQLKVQQIDAVGVRVYARVRGPLAPSVAVTSIKTDRRQSVGSLFAGPSDLRVSYTVANTGNVRLTPRALLEVGPILGSSESRSTQLPELLPGGSITVNQTFEGLAPSIVFHAHVSVTSDVGAKATGSATIWALPWLLILVVVLVMAALVLWYRRRRTPASGSSSGDGDADGAPDRPTSGGGGARHRAEATHR